MHHTTTARELLEKKKPKQELFITSCAIVIKKMLFVGNTYEDCFYRSGREGVNHLSIPHDVGYLATDGKFYDPLEAGMIAYRSWQTPKLCSPLKPEDIF